MMNSSAPKQSFPISILSLVICLSSAGASFVSGCASHGPTKNDARFGADPEQITANHTAVKITYTLGHIQHQLILESSPETIRGKTLSDHQVLEEGAINRDGFASYIQRVARFVDAPRREIASQSTCRNPFTITLTSDGLPHKSFTGCRATDGGDFSRLVKEGEFLLYSQK